MNQPKKDKMLHITLMDGMVRGLLLTATNTVTKAAAIHCTSPVATAALGRSLMGTAMMGAMLKQEDASVTVTIDGGGPIGRIVCVADHNSVRGCVDNPKLEIPNRPDGKLAVGMAVGNEGRMSVVKDMGMKSPYVGQVALVSGEIADDVTAYFAQSEQTPTACALGVLVDRDLSVKVAGGYLVQLLPGAPDDIIDKLETGIQRAGAVTAMLEAGMTPEDILGQVCGELGVVFMETTEVSYKCYCSRDRVTAALISLGREELEEIAREDKTFPVECQFCDTVYEFTPENVRELLKKI